MKKYFLFRKEEVSITSVTASDQVGLSLLAVPTDSIAYISSELGRVNCV